jgi:hypothetical protein
MPIKDLPYLPSFKERIYFVFMYENRKMKPVEIILRSGGRWREKKEWVNLIN